MKLGRYPHKKHDCPQMRMSTRGNNGPKGALLPHSCAISSSAVAVERDRLRTVRIEEDLVDQLFNSTEKRLARTLLLLARYSTQDQPIKMLPKVTQEMLAEMIGATRPRVNFFMTKFKKLGFIQYNGGLQIHNSLLSVVLLE